MPQENSQNPVKLSSHITFNSLTQWKRYSQKKLVSSPEKVSPGIRVNQRWSPVGTALYNPASLARLGEPAENFKAYCPKESKACTFTRSAKSLFTSYDLEKTLGFSRINLEVFFRS
ncbi:MAG: hypothetical protein R2778_02020 [Saprospiraceae bacterium]